MNHAQANISAADIAEGTAQVSVISILVSGLIYCVALLV
ncbi:MAG: hypothetical protein ACI9OO_001738 [Bacteroidia bacterium]|jgi:hypothetical protein